MSFNPIELAKVVRRSIRNYYRNQKNPVLSYQDAQRKIEFEKMEDVRRINIRKDVTLSDKQKNEIDRLYLRCYGSKIPYTWHEYYTAFTGKFDVNYFPELLYIPEFEFYMNQNEDFNRAIEDKNFISNIAESIGLKYPKNIVSCVRGVFREGHCSLISKEKAISLFSDSGRVFIKPTVNSGSGKDCFIANLENGIDTISSRSANAILADMGTDFAVQDIVVCSDDIRRIYPDSVNTFRVISFIWRTEIVTMPIIMRIGHGGNCLDNAHAGGMFIAVENDGYLHKTAFTEFETEYVNHPDTGVVFDGYKISGVSKLIEAAKLPISLS